MGGAAVTIPVPNRWGKGDPNLPGTSEEGNWEWSKAGGKQSPPLLVSPGQLCVPSMHAWGPAAALGGVTGDPHSSAGCLHPHRPCSGLGGPGPAPRCAGWGGQVPLAGSRSPPALGPPPLPVAVLHHRGDGGGGVGSIPSVVPSRGSLTPPFGHMSPGGLCLSPHPGAVARPLAGTHEFWCSRLWIHYCFQTAAKGWAGGVLQSPGHLTTLRAPPTAWGPPCGPSCWGWGGLATGACQAGLRVPRGPQTGLWAPKNPGDHPELPGGGGHHELEGCGGEAA